MTCRPAARSRLHLHPGHVLIAREPAIVTTVLGSCVAVTLFHARSGLAAICHIMLPAPHAVDAAAAGPDPRGLRFAAHAIPAMLQPFRQLGVAAGEIEAKMFGGANVLQFEAPPEDSCWIGEANIKAARERLHAAGVQLVAENVGGCRGRKIIFHTDSGEVLHKFLERAPAAFRR